MFDALLPKSASMHICVESRHSCEKAHANAEIWRHSMSVRTSRKSVTFTRPFSLSGIDEVQPAGTYAVETDEELLPGLSFPAYRRIATLIFLRSRGGGPVVEEVANIDPLGAAGSSGKRCRPAHPRRLPQRLSRPEHRAGNLKIAPAAALAVWIGAA
jgi:hypothetical protein